MLIFKGKDSKEMEESNAVIEVLNSILRKYDVYCNEDISLYLKDLSSARQVAKNDKERMMIDFALQEASIVKKQLNDSARRITLKCKALLEKKEE